MNANTKDDDKKLRLKAEKLLRSSHPESGPLTALDKLMHELQVHQIELEMQNQELTVAKFALEQSKAHYLELYDFAPIGYLTLNSRGVVSECNLTASNMLGINRNQIIKNRLESLVDAEFLEIWSAFFQQARQSQDKYNDELPFRTANGTERVFRADCLVILDEAEFPTLRLILTDITEQKNAEIALRDSEKRRIKEQNALRDNLAEAIKMQAVIQTAITIAHNINQPLTAINFCAEAAVKMEKTGIKNHKELSRCLEIISQEALRAGEAIPTLLSSLCAEEHSSQHSLDINIAVSSAINLFESNNPLKPKVMQHLSADIPMVIGNGLHIEQVVMSLLQNSLETMEMAGKSDEAITVSTCIFPNDSNRVQVTVSDSGIGVQDINILRKMFEPFYTSKTNGLGLGLTICKTLLDKVSGHIWAEENSTTGLTVIFTLLIDNRLNLIG